MVPFKCCGSEGCGVCSFHTIHLSYVKNVWVHFKGLQTWYWYCRTKMIGVLAIFVCFIAFDYMINKTSLECIGDKISQLDLVSFLELLPHIVARPTMLCLFVTRPVVYLRSFPSRSDLPEWTFPHRRCPLDSVTHLGRYQPRLFHLNLVRLRYRTALSADSVHLTQLKTKNIATSALTIQLRDIPSSHLVYSSDVFFVFIFILVSLRAASQ